MIVAISYHDGDLDLMTRWVNHVYNLGPYPSHKIVIAPAHGVTADGIKEKLSTCFGEVIVERCHHTQVGWPISCNLAFEQVAWLASQKLKSSFLWMEPDAVPLKSSWIDDIERAYTDCGKPFMGDFVGISGIMPNGIDHMSGIAVYHWNMASLAPSIFNNEKTAWDIASARDVVGKMARTNLIHHDWVPEKKWRRDIVTKDCIKEGAVIYHPDKKGVLFNDGLIPNGAGGDPQTGVPCEGSPHETKEIIKAVVSPLDVLLDEIINHAKTNSRTKKKITQRLCEEGLIPKAKATKQSGKKVRSSVGKRGRPRVGDGVQIPSDSQVEI